MGFVLEGQPSAALSADGFLLFDNLADGSKRAVLRTFAVADAVRILHENAVFYGLVPYGTQGSFDREPKQRSILFERIPSARFVELFGQEIRSRV